MGGGTTCTIVASARRRWPSAIAIGARRYLVNLPRAGAALPHRSDLAVAPNGFDDWREAFRILQAREVWETYGDFITRAKPRLGAGIKERMAFAATVTAEQAASARKTVAAARA